MKLTYFTILGGALLASAIAPMASAEDVRLPVSSGACSDYLSIAQLEAKRQVAERDFPEFAHSVDRTPPEGAVRRSNTQTRRPKDGTCSYSIDVDASMLKILLADYPAGLSNTPVAALIRYVRDGSPVAGDTPDAAKATQILLDQLDKIQAHPIELVGMGEDFRKLAFFDVSKCAITGGGDLDFEAEECQLVLDYDASVDRIVDMAREIAELEVSSENGIGNPQLRPLATCDGVVAVGQVTAAKSTTVRNQLDVSIQLTAYRYSDRSLVLSYPDTVTRRLTRLAGERASIEAEAIDEILQKATNQLAEKVSRSGQNALCK